MAVTTYWDESFNVKTLQPSFKSYNSLASPQTIQNQAAVELQIAENEKIFRIPIATGKTVVIEVSDSSTNPFDGFINVDLSSEFELPLEGVKRIRITNTSGGALDLSFMLLKIAGE